MNLAGYSGLLGFIFTLIFLILMLVSAQLERRRTRREGGKIEGAYSRLRRIPEIERLKRTIGLAVEAGQRLHLSLGWGGINGVQGASALVGLSILQRMARTASISDRPPVATSGEGAITILSQDTMRSAYVAIGNSDLYDPALGQMTGPTPFSYAAGALCIIYDQQVSANVLAGHFGPEVALIADAGERSGSLTLAGSDNLPAQAALYASAQEPLIGEELYAGGAYLQAGLMHVASLRTQDIMRWALAVLMILGVALKLAGVW